MRWSVGVVALALLGCTPERACPVVLRRPIPDRPVAATRVAQRGLGSLIVPACIAVQTVHAEDGDGHTDTLPALALLPCPGMEPTVDTVGQRSQ